MENNGEKVLSQYTFMHSVREIEQFENEQVQVFSAVVDKKQ